MFVIALALWLLSRPSVYAQTDSAQVLPEFISTKERADRRVIELESGSNDLSDQLLSSSSLDIRSNGRGVLSTVSFRGGRTTQTTAQWMGLSIESPTNATVDLALIPSFLFDRAELTATSANIVGPGAISGALLMSNRTPGRKRSSVQARFGSFESAFIGLDHETILGLNWSMRTRFFADHALNNFKYTDFDQEQVRISNHLRNATGVMHEIHGSFKNWNVTSRTWWQEYYRQIPPTMLQTMSEKEQVDRNLRTALRLAWSQRSQLLDINLAYGNEFLNYSDPIADLDEDYFTDQLVALVRYHRPLTKRTLVTLQLDDRFAAASASEYYNDNRNEVSPGIQLKWTHTKWGVRTGLRKSFYLNNRSPLLLNSDFSYSSDKQSVLISYSNNYRLPSMNDLFWRPGGNPDLAPEQSHRAEVEWKLAPQSWSLSTTVFLHQIYNQIRWLPSSGGVFEATQSEETVWNRGVELTAAFRDTLRRLVIIPTIHGQVLLSSSSDQSRSPFEYSTDHQQIYVPLYRVSCRIAAHHQSGIQGRIELIHVDDRSVLPDRSKFIEDYLLLNCMLAYELGTDLMFSYEVQNASNQLYFNQQFRPMPGIFHSMTINYEIQGK